MNNYKPDYSSREAHYANKDAAMARHTGKPEAAREGELKFHDFRDSGWGYSANIDKVFNEGHKVEMHGFGSGIRQGDFIIKKSGDGFASYRVDTITYHRDPPDMWKAKASYTPGFFGITDEGKIVRIDSEGCPVKS